VAVEDLEILVHQAVLGVIPSLAVVRQVRGTSNGVAGTSGGGGSGGSSSSTSRTGGAGGAGLIRIWEFS
jgi:hypothetical protein